jgi:FdhD protein
MVGDEPPISSIFFDIQIIKKFGYVKKFIFVTQIKGIRFLQKEKSMDPFQNIDIIHMKKSGMITKELPVTTESPLTICINNYIFDQIMRTPGDEKQQVAGLLFDNKIISSSDDLNNFSLSRSIHGDIVRIQIRNKQIGLSFNGKKQTHQLKSIKLSLTDIQACFNALSHYQPIRNVTRSTHAAILFDRSCNPISAKEDVGRHNALDKVIGQAFIDDTLVDAYILVLSSRVSHELISKVVKTPVKCILSVSRPTSLAVDIARKQKISLACLSKNDGVLIFSGEIRFQMQ